MEKEWKNGGVSGVEESTECRRDRTCLLRQFIAIIFSQTAYRKSTSATPSVETGPVGEKLLT